MQDVPGKHTDPKGLCRVFRPLKEHLNEFSRINPVALGDGKQSLRCSGEEACIGFGCFGYKQIIYSQSPVKSEISTHRKGCKRE